MQNHPNEILIKRHLLRYLLGEISLRHFRRWFVPATWHVEEWAPVPLQDLVYGIKLRLAEYTSGHWSEAQLRELLLPFVRSYTVTLQEEPDIFMAPLAHQAGIACVQWFATQASGRQYEMAIR